MWRARTTEIARAAALAEHESGNGDAVADAIARTTIEEVAMPRVDRYEGGEVAPGKAGIGRNAGVDDRIVAVTLAIEIILGITGGIVVHVDEIGRASCRERVSQYV